MKYLDSIPIGGSPEMVRNSRKTHSERLFSLLKTSLFEKSISTFDKISTMILRNAMIAFISAFLWNGAFAQTTIISPTGAGAFEGVSFTADGWSVLNNATQGASWVQSTGATAGFSGSQCAYITTNTAATPPPHAYTNSVSRVSALYRDVTIPAGETTILLSFKWICLGESSYDRLQVFAVPTSYTPLNGASSISTNGSAPTGRVRLQPGANSYVGSSVWSTATYTVPAAYAGTTFRLVFQWNNDNSAGSNPPAGIDDVSLTSSCSGPASAAATNVGFTSATANWTALAGATDYNLRYRIVGSPSWTTLSNLSGTATSLVSLTAYSNYEYQVQANGPVCSAWGNITNLYTGPCSASSSTTAYAHITNVSTTGEIQDLSNNTGAASAGGYGNFTSQVLMAAPSDVVNMTVSLTPSYSGYVRVFVDWNNDLDFADTGEQVVTTGSAASHNVTFTVPAAQAAGSYSMRVRSDWFSAPAACGALTYGETEDYTLTVVGPCSAAPNAPTVVATASTFCQGASTNFTGSAFGPYSGFTHQWKSSTTVGGPYTNVVPAGALTCAYTFNLTDQYSDGWNGGLIQVRDAANAVVATLGGTFTTGGSASQSVTLTSGQAYTLFWSTAGSYPEEMGMTVVDPTGATVYSLAYNGQAGVNTTLATVNASCPSTYGQQASFDPGVLPAGTYYYVLESTCPNGGASATSSELVITVNALPNVTISGPNGGAFCGTQEMTASGAATYTWAPANKVSATTGTSVFFTGVTNSSITVTGVDANGCTATSPAYAVTYTAPTDITLTSDVPNFCGTGGTAVVTASSSADYAYTFDVVSGGATLSNTTATTTEVVINQTSAVRVTGFEAATGCSAQAFKSVGVYPLPTATVTTTATGVCPGTSATINSGLTAGNFSVSSTSYNWRTAPATATTIANNGQATVALGGGSLDDGGWANLPIGFNYNFFGSNFNTIAAGTNGLLMFGTVPGYSTAAGNLGQYSFNTTGGVFPNANNPGNVIALMAADQYFGNGTAGSASGSIKYWTEGYAPNRVFVIQYADVDACCSNATTGFSAQAQLFETTGIAEIHIQNKSNTNSATVGLQNGAKTIGAVAPGRQAFTSTIATPEAWRFAPPSNYAVNWYADGVQMPAQVTTPSNGYNEFSYAVSPSVTTDYSIIYTNTVTGCANSVGSAEVTMDVLSNVAPTGVTTIASDSTVCSSIAFDLSSSYTGSTSGQTYQWQVSTDAGLTWNDMLNDTLIVNAATTQTAVSSYRIGIAQCGGTVEYSSPLAVTLNPYQDCYCTPTYNSGTTYGDLISNVEIVGTTLSNNSGFVAGTPDYVDYTGNTALTAELLPSTSYTVNVSTGEWGSQGFAAWIDYNDDGIFTTSVDPLLNERIGATTGQVGTGYTPGAISGSSSFTITLACTPPAGAHRMRVRCAYATNGVNIDPCANYGYGETEDYLITIQAAPSCPNPGLMSVPTATTNANDVTLQWLMGCSTASNFDFEYGPAGFTLGTGTTVSNVAATMSVTGDTATYALTGLNSLTDYSVYYRANCGAGDYSAWSVVTNFTTAPSCFPPSAVTVSNVTTSAATITWTSNPLSPSADYQYYLSQTNTAPANGVVAGTVDLADTTVTVTGLTSMTTYYMWVRSDCGAGDRSVWTSVATIAVNPCMPAYTSGTNAGDMISFVEITGTTLSNNSGFNAGDPAYEYFAPTSANLTATMNAGGTYNVNVSTGEWGSQGFAAWIDYNDDGIFTTSVDPLLNERIGATTGQVGTGFTPGEINGSASFTINLGCTPPVGTHRMRVRCAYAVNGVNIDPCNNYGYGQTEEYMVTIAGLIPFAPSFTATNATACTGVVNEVVYAATAGQTSYAWTYTDGSNNALVDGVDYAVTYSATSDTASVTWLTAGTKVVGMNYNNPAGCSSTGATSTNTVVTLETVPGSLVFASNAGNTGGTISYNATGAIGSIAGGWQKSIDGGTTWTAIAPNGPNSYTFNNLTVETKFRVLVTNGSCSTLPTNVITGYVPGAGLSNAIQVNTIGTFGTGVQTTYSSNLAGGLDSPQSPGAGLDKWFRFTATENAVRIAVVGSTSTADDNDIAIYNAPVDFSSTAPMIPLSTENDVAVGAQGIAADAGSETMVYADLVPGTEYFVSVRNINAAAGTVNVTFSYLRGGAADIMPYTNYTGVYSNTCQNFKAAFRSGSTGYTVNRWTAASDLSGGLTPNFTYAIPVGTGTSPATICQLGRIVPANLTGAAIPYYVTVDATYNVKDAFGNDNIVTAIGRTVTTFTLNAETDLNVRTTDRCPVYKSATSGSVATNRSVCGTNRYEWSFAQTLPSPALPVEVLGAVGGSRILAMSAVTGIAAGQTYDVQIRSKHFDGVSNTNYGTTQCVRTLGTAGMPTVEEGGVIAERSENGVTTSIYPNPNNGQSVNFAVSGMEGEMNVRIADATGRMVYANRYIVEGSLNTTIDFGQTLAGGVYMVEMIQNGEMKTMRMVVSK